LLDAELKARARGLLDEGRLSRTEMADALGFDDPTSFSRACRRWFGQVRP
jgi:AraC-like DNA-binding protein